VKGIEFDFIRVPQSAGQAIRSGFERRELFAKQVCLREQRIELS